MITTRRQALAWGSALCGTALIGSRTDAQDENSPAGQDLPEVSIGPNDQLFKISLAQWSLHKALFSDKNDPNHLPALMFPAKARRDFGIGAVEYVNSFYRDVVGNESYLNQLKSVADSEGVISLLIMCDGEGQLGDPDPQARTQSIENHYKWADMAAHLGCRSIRVNAFSSGSFEDQQAYATDGLVRLAEYTRQFDMSVIVENHGGWSSHGAWLAGVMKRANNEYVGTLPDFGNFSYGNGESYDPYLGVEELMPYAHGVSAKSFGFDAKGNESDLDYERLIRIILDSGFRGHIGIEYEGNELREREGIIKTKQLLERLRAQLAPEYG